MFTEQSAKSTACSFKLSLSLMFQIYETKPCSQTYTSWRNYSLKGEDEKRQQSFTYHHLGAPDRASHCDVTMRNIKNQNSGPNQTATFRRIFITPVAKQKTSWKTSAAFQLQKTFLRLVLLQNHSLTSSALLWGAKAVFSPFSAQVSSFGVLFADRCRNSCGGDVTNK